MAAKRKAVIYTRVSTDDQATNGVSLGAQFERARGWCNLNELTVVGVGEDKTSGKRADNRESLQAALTQVCAVRGVLVVYSLSRLARSVRDTLDIADRLQKAGADLVSLTENIDTTTACGTMLFRLLAVLAEFERDLISERTSAALQHKKRNGEVYGEVPYGYVRVSSGHLQRDSYQHGVIEEMRQKREQGLSFQAIADDLNRARVASAKGGRWDKKTVARIVKRESWTIADLRQEPPSEEG
jgi:DNA invertase Pin-like site-specific DNA recombinase